MTSITPTPQSEIYAAIGKERDYQDRKYGRPHDRDLSIGAWLKIVENELVESIEAGDRNDALAELLQVAAVCVACLEVHGLVERENLEKDKKTDT